MTDISMNVFPKESYPLWRSHLVRLPILLMCRTFSPVWGLMYSQWNSDCFGNSYPWMFFSISCWTQLFPWMILPTNFCNSEISSCSDTYFVDMSNICLSVRSVVFPMDWQLFWWFFPMKTVDFIVCLVINIPQIIECSSPSPEMLEILFCLFRTWSFTRFTNDLDSTDNSNSVSSFPMMKFWGLATSWELIISGRPDLSRSVSPFLTDGAVPSKRISSWSGRTFLTILQEVSSGRPDRSYVVVLVLLEFHRLIVDSVKVSVFWSWFEPSHPNLSCLPMHRSIGACRVSYQDTIQNPKRRTPSCVEDWWFFLHQSKTTISIDDFPNQLSCSDTNLAGMSNICLSVRSIVLEMEWRLSK